MGKPASTRAKRRYPDQQSANTRALKIQELEARINSLEREKSILKKATELLMAEEHERSR